MGGDFDKAGFFKGPLPICNTCGARCGYERPEHSEPNATGWCKNCLHWLNTEGECISKLQRRCVSCMGRPECSRCSRRVEQVGTGVEQSFNCPNCSHDVDDDGSCLGGNDCQVCNPPSCNQCGDSNDVRPSSGGGYFWCTYCKHEIDGDGDCCTDPCDTCDEDDDEDEEEGDCPECGDSNCINGPITRGRDLEGANHDHNFANFVVFQCSSCGHSWAEDNF